MDRERQGFIRMILMCNANIVCYFRERCKNTRASYRSATLGLDVEYDNNRDHRDTAIALNI